VTKAHVLGVVTFYTMYFDKPMGGIMSKSARTSAACSGRTKIYDEVSKQLGIGHRECTADGKYSLEEVECMGACAGRR